MDTTPLRSATSAVDLTLALDALMTAESTWAALIQPDGGIALDVLAVRDGSPLNQMTLERVNFTILGAQSAIVALWPTIHALLADMGMSADEVVQRFGGSGERVLRVMAGPVAVPELVRAVSAAMRGIVALHALHDAHVACTAIPLWMVHGLISEGERGIESMREIPALVPRPGGDDGGTRVPAPVRLAA
jgi:hypothetical protein